MIFGMIFRHISPVSYRMGPLDVPLRRSGFGGGRPLEDYEPKTFREFLSHRHMDGLPSELKAFQHLDDLDDLRTFFPFTNCLRLLGLRRGMRFISVGGGIDPAPQISAALLGADSLLIDLGRSEVASVNDHVATIMDTKVGEAIRAAGGRIKAEEDDFLYADIKDNSVRVLLLANVINQPSNPDKDEIAEKALKVTEPDGVIILTDSHNTLSWSMGVLKDASARIGVRLEEITNLEINVAHIGLSQGSPVAYRVKK